MSGLYLGLSRWTCSVWALHQKVVSKIYHNIPHRIFIQERFSVRIWVRVDGKIDEGSREWITCSVSMTSEGGLDTWEIPCKIPEIPSFFQLSNKRLFYFQKLVVTWHKKNIQVIIIFNKWVNRMTITINLLIYPELFQKFSVWLWK